MMITEQQEFQISQYCDGTLPQSQRAAVTELLRGHAEIQQLLGEYQQLDSHLANLPSVPAVKWDRLAEHLAMVVDQQSARRGIAGRIFPAIRSWQLRSAAAIFVLATGGAIWMKAAHRAAPSVHPLIGASMVAGPQAEVPAGPGALDIKVGPSPAIAQRPASWRYADGVVNHGPSKVTITAGVNPVPRSDSHTR
jgi:anti-sigma factor RsiW